MPRGRPKKAVAPSVEESTTQGDIAVGVVTDTASAVAPGTPVDGNGDPLDPKKFGVKSFYGPKEPADPAKESVNALSYALLGLSTLELEGRSDSETVAAMNGFKKAIQWLKARA